MFFGTKFDEMLKECEKWEQEDISQVDNSVKQDLLPKLLVDDKQTRNVIQGILVFVAKYSEVKLLVDYDKEIMMILPKETRMSNDEIKVLVKLGWESLEYKPWMWQFKVDGYVAEYY